MNKLSFVWIVSLFFCLNSQAQEKALVNTSSSPYAKLHSVDMGDVSWTTGFWAERFKVCRESMVPQLWKVYTSANISHAYRNFEIAAGLDTGSFKGPSFHDGDFYKTLEAVSSMYASTKDKKLDDMLDKVIATIAKCQRKDGYIYTKAMIEQKKTGVKKQFEERLSFEAYNIGHLMTAACVHYRATGKRNLLDIAIKATDYLCEFYDHATTDEARNAICPSHYMGLIEMYRTLGDKRYLALARHLIAIKGKADDGTDDNQDRIPFLEQTGVTGHAVRANYLYAGVADLYAETGDTALLSQLHVMWNDMTRHKMYITGGCGSLYDGVSPDGTSYSLADVQQIHQAYGREYQLPNFTAHDETCANVANVLWNWRMLQVSGDAKYADVMELALYNSVLSGISLDGTKFLYTNPLSVSDALPYKLRWSKDRVPYIGFSNCCPPNVVRTVTEIGDYAYSVSDKGVWVNLYGGSNLTTKLEDGSELKLNQETAYPWNGNIKIEMQQTSGKAFSVFLRIPGWASGADLLINGKPFEGKVAAGSYAEVNRPWKKGDKIELNLKMETQLIESNPLVEETRNQIAVKRGPVVYCIESVDMPKGESIFNVDIPASIKFTPKLTSFENSNIMSLEGTAMLIKKASWDNQLYKKVANEKPETAKIKLVPYYSWGNRGHSEMTVWMPFSR